MRQEKQCFYLVKFKINSGNMFNKYIKSLQTLRVEVQ